MKIDRLEFVHVAMPLIYPWRTAYGEDAAIHSVLCRMTSGSVGGKARHLQRLAIARSGPAVSSRPHGTG